MAVVWLLAASLIANGMANAEVMAAGAVQEVVAQQEVVAELVTLQAADDVPPSAALEPTTAPVVAGTVASVEQWRNTSTLSRRTSKLVAQAAGEHMGGTMRDTARNTGIRTRRSL